MLRVRCFGRVAIEGRDGRELSLRSRKHTGLLLYLVSNARSVHTREDLADLLWEGTGPRERHSLSQALYDIRSNLDDLVEVTTSTVRLLPERIAFDGADFERAVDRGAHDAALELYQGDFAPELANLGSEPFDRWVDAERERHRVLASLALRNAQRAAEERGDWDAMCLASLRLVRLNEFDEEAHCALMRGLCMKGDPASALRHYRNLAAELVEDWPTLRAFAERLESSGAVREVLTVPSKAIELVGREREFEQLFDAYRRYGRRGGVVAVTGERGIGKTALLREFARLVEARGETVVWGADASETRLDAGTVMIFDGKSHAPDPDWSGWKEPIGFNAITCGLVEAAAIPPHIRQVRLGPLSDEAVGYLVGLRDASAMSIKREQITRLAAGNPGTAAKLCSLGWSGLESFDLTRLCGDRLADRCVRGSVEIRQIGEAWLQDLQDGELGLAELIAVLTPAGRAFVREIVPDEESAQAYESLTRRDWLVQKEGGVHVRHPLAAAALRARLSLSERRTKHREAARILSTGPLAARLAAALEWRAAGEAEAASYAAEQAATDALERGDSVSATRGARLACGTATSIADRIRTSLLSAEAELERGRTERAAMVARSILDLSDADETRLEAQLLLSRALLQEGAWSELHANQVVTQRLLRAVSDRLLSRKADLQLAHVGLAVAVRPEGDSGPKVEQLASHLEGRLHESVGFLESLAGPWNEAFRSVFLFRATNTSRDRAERLLTDFSPAMMKTGRGLADLALMSRIFLQARSGMLRQAIDGADDLLSDRRCSEDRTRAAVLNNVGVIQTELGEFDAARQLLEELRGLDESLALPLPDRLTTLVNLAQTEWFSGNHPKAMSLSRTVLRGAQACQERGIEAEVNALIGLLALERGDEREALISFDRLSDCRNKRDLTQDQCLISWLQAEISHLRGNDPTDDLWEAADRLCSFDLVAARKLRVLACRFGVSEDRLAVARSEARQLRIGGAGWFVRRVRAPALV